jgi:hypothetical protein
LMSVYVWECQNGPFQELKELTESEIEYQGHSHRFDQFTSEFIYRVNCDPIDRSDTDSFSTMELFIHCQSPRPFVF